MRKFATMAIAAALACSALAPALAGDTVASTIVAIDTKHRAVILDDKTVMLVAHEVDLGAISVGMKVESMRSSTKTVIPAQWRSRR